MINSNPVPPRYYRRFTVYGRNANNLIASVSLRAATRLELFSAAVPYVILDQVWTHRAYRGQGYASELLSMAKNEVERQQWVIYCRPVAHDGGPGPNQRQLEKFYRNRGFGDLQGVGQRWMGYFPSSVYCAPAA